MRKTIFRNNNRFFDSLKKKLGLFILFILPFQLGKFFFFNFSFINGIQIDYFSIKIFFSDIVILIFLILNKNVILSNIKKNAKAYTFFLTLALVNIFQAKQPILSLYQFIKAFEVICLFLCLLNTKYSKRDILFAFFFGTAIELLLVILQLSSQSSIQGIFYFLGERFFTSMTPGISKASIFGKETIRPYGTFPHPNSLAGFYLLLFVFITCTFGEKIKDFKEKLLFVGLSVSCSLIIIFSFSKIALFGLFIFYWYAILKKKYPCKICALSQIAIALYIAFLLLSFSSDPFSLNKRIIGYNFGLHLFANYWLFGVGLGQHIYFQKTLNWPYTDSLFQPIHNIFLILLSELGIFFAGSILAVIGLWTMKNRKTNLLLCLAVIFYTGLFDHYWITLQQNTMIAGTILALASQHK